MKYFVVFLSLVLLGPVYGETVWQKTQGDFSAKVTQSKEILKNSENLELSLELHYPSDYTINPAALTTKLLQNNTALPAPFKLVSLKTNKTPEGTVLSYELSPQWEGKFDLSFYAIEFKHTSKKDLKPVTIISGIFPVQIKFEKSELETPFEPAPLMNFSTKLPIKVDYQNKKTIARERLNAIEDNKSLAENSQRLTKMLATLLFIGCLILWIKLNKKSPIISEKEKIATARSKALKSLEQIENQKIEGENSYKMLYTNLSQTIRTYLEDCYRLKAPQKTTQEFFSASNLENFPTTIPLEELKEFLWLSDQVKFAKLIPHEKEFQHAVRMAKNFVNKDGA